MNTEFDKLAAEGFPIFLGSEIDQAAPEQAFFHVLPVPYEKTVSYGGGTGNGPAAILEASWQLEEWDGYSKPCDLGIHTAAPVSMQGTEAQIIENIAKDTAKIVAQGGYPVILGGEHSITNGVIQGLLAAGITDIGVVQIDAHADLREAYEGNPFSHASVMKRVVDLGVPLYQLGIRAICEEENATRAKHGVLYQDAAELVQQNIQQIELPADFPKNVFFTLDVDGLDPSVFPATGTPVQGGLSWYQTLNLFESVVKQRKVIGFDVVELAPIKGFHAYEFAASLLTYKMMGIVARNYGSQE